MEFLSRSAKESALREQILDSLTYLAAGLGEPLQGARTWIIKRTCTHRSALQPRLDPSALTLTPLAGATTTRPRGAAGQALIRG
ncbi:hypothetical protein SAMN05216281_10517 [Cryobacterium luteum]|nr:hypothetical protein SAMN05216281_10517 [Cryobacterium luteum]